MAVILDRAAVFRAVRRRRRLWHKACAHDHIDPRAEYVIFSHDNPYFKPSCRAYAIELSLKKALQRYAETEVR